MKKKYLINILLVIILIIAVTGYYAYNAFNRTNESLSNIEAAYLAIPQTLLDEFSKDVKSAGQKYFDKIVQVEGPVKNIETSDKGMSTIIVGDQNSMSSLRFSMDSTETEKIKNIQLNSMVIIKGMCTGYNADEMGLGSDLLFNRAVIIKK